MNHNQIMDETAPERFQITSMLLVRISLAFMFRIGSILIQVSSIPVKNVNMILMQNIIELSIATVTFFIAGYTIVFGDLTKPEWTFGSIFTTNSQVEIEYAAYAWTAITTTTAIFTTMTAGRMHVVGYIVVTMLLSGLLQPAAMRVAWSQSSFAQNNTFLETPVTYVDFAGISHVHLLAGTAAFLATIFIGRRLIIVKDIDEASLPPGSDTALTIGYVLVIAGTVGLTIPHTMINGTFNDPFGVKCGLAINGGILAALACEMILIRRRLNSWAIARCLQGGIAGLVIVSNGTLLHSSMMCLMLGALGGLLFYIIQHVMFKSAIEDYCNVIPIHFYCGFLSPIMTVRIADLLNVALSQLAWELIVHMCLICMYVMCLVPVFLLLMGLGLLRNRQCAIEHSLAVKALHSQSRGRFFKRLFPPGSNPALLLPGSKERRKEYLDQRLTEEVEVKLKTLESPTKRKRRVEDDGAVTNKKKGGQRNHNEVRELGDFEAGTRGKRMIKNRNVEVRYAMMNRMKPMALKKSSKYQVNRKRANLAGGDAGSTLEGGKGNAEKFFWNFEDLPDERRFEVLEEMKRRQKGINQIPEGSNALQGIQVGDLAENQKMGVDEVGAAGRVAGVDEFMGKKRVKLVSKEKLEEWFEGVKSGWVYKAAGGEKAREVEDSSSDEDKFDC